MMRPGAGKADALPAPTLSGMKAAPLSQIEFYRARIREAEEGALDATLSNVRDRNLRSLEAWRKLADRAERIAKGRDARQEPVEG